MLYLLGYVLVGWWEQVNCAGLWGLLLFAYRIAAAADLIPQYSPAMHPWRHSRFVVFFLQPLMCLGLEMWRFPRYVYVCVCVCVCVWVGVGGWVAAKQCCLFSFHS